jgi:hypothetical protein
MDREPFSERFPNVPSHHVDRDKKYGSKDVQFFFSEALTNYTVLSLRMCTSGFAPGVNQEISKRGDCA